MLEMHLSELLGVFGSNDGMIKRIPMQSARYNCFSD